MSTKSTELAKTGGALVHQRALPSKHVHLDLEDAVPRPKVEVVSEQEKRHEEQLRPKAEPPEAFFKNAPIIKEPLAPGVTVPRKTLEGFLAAFEEITQHGTAYPIMANAKVTTSVDPAQKVFVEAASPNVWAVVAIKTSQEIEAGFSVMLPIGRSKNVLAAIPEYENITLGVTDEGVCLGPNIVPFGGRVEDFPARPLVREAAARAGMPAFYLKEICERVLCAKSADSAEIGLQGVLLDFEPCEIDGEVRVLCTAVATDGARMHILRLPQMPIESAAPSALPPTVTVPGHFFRYLLAIVNREWSAVEIAEEQIHARGEDYLVVAKATMSGKTSMKGLSSWRTVNIEHPGFWIVDRQVLEQIVEAAPSDDLLLRFDAIRKRVEASSQGNYRASVTARHHSGAPVADVLVDKALLLDAIVACNTGLIRMSFAYEPAEQRKSPIIIRGEDEQFKALLMPKSR
jgi:hypothetical protein